MKKIFLYLFVFGCFVSCSTHDDAVENPLGNTSAEFTSLDISSTEKESLAQQGISLHQVTWGNTNSEMLVAFKNSDFMEQFAQQEEGLQELIKIQKANLLLTYVDKSPEYLTQGRVEDETEIDSEFLARLLNQDGVLQIGEWPLRIDQPNESVYVLPVAHRQLYPQLVTETPSHPEIMTFSTNDEVLTLLEEGIRGTNPSSRVELFCGDKRAWYCRETSNTPDANIEYRIKGTHAYRKYGVWFELYSTARLQRLTKPFSLWVDAWGDIEVHTGGFTQHRCKPGIGSVGGCEPKKRL